MHLGEVIRSKRTERRADVRVPLRVILKLKGEVELILKFVLILRT
jgi:hypothetical protein